MPCEWRKGEPSRPSPQSPHPSCVSATGFPEVVKPKKINPKLYVNINIYIYINMNMNMNMDMNMNMNMNINININKHIYIYTHIYIYRFSIYNSQALDARLLKSTWLQVLDL